MPLSDDEQRLLNQIEADLSASDPRLAQHVADTTLYRHSARLIGWASAGVVAGGVLMLATFTTTLLLGAFGFLVMLACLLVIERHVRRIGRAGLEDLAGSQKNLEVQGRADEGHAAARRSGSRTGARIRPRAFSVTSVRERCG